MRERARTPRKARSTGVAAASVSIAGHALVLLALFSARTNAPDMQEPAAITVALTPPPKPPPPPPQEPSTPQGPAKVQAAAAPVKNIQADQPRPAPRSSLRPVPVPPSIVPLPANLVPARTPTLTVGEGLLASAGTADGPGGAGNGAGGGDSGCNMVRLLQNALRKNPKVRAAVAQAHPDAVSAGQAIMVWNGDWVRSGAQDGKGLAGLRQAIALEVAFAPEACRADSMRGLVLIRLNDGPEPVRLVMGSDRWRWSDLLFAG
jgi:hypothetical protein